MLHSPMKVQETMQENATAMARPLCPTEIITRVSMSMGSAMEWARITSKVALNITANTRLEKNTVKVSEF